MKSDLRRTMPGWPLLAFQIHDLQTDSRFKHADGTRIALDQRCVTRSNPPDLCRAIAHSQVGAAAGANLVAHQWGHTPAEQFDHPLVSSVPLTRNLPEQFLHTQRRCCEERAGCSHCAIVSISAHRRP